MEIFGESPISTNNTPLRFSTAGFHLSTGTPLPVHFRQIPVCLCHREEHAMAYTLQKLNLLLELSYRRSMLVDELMIFPDTRPGASYYVCPRCQITLEREFAKYCDRCGQCLGWEQYEWARIVFPGRQKSRAKAKSPSPAVRSEIRRILSFAR